MVYMSRLANYYDSKFTSCSKQANTVNTQPDRRQPHALFVNKGSDITDTVYDDLAH